MQRASSVNRLTNPAPADISRSPSVRAIYINEQTSKRSLNTHFHSPFKDGRRNKDYVNPSFVSTHLLYPREMINKQQVTVRQNYIPHESERRKDELYRQRINTEMNEQRAIKEKFEKVRKAKEAKKGVKDSTQASGPKFIDPEQGLKNQLNNLQNYRQLQASQTRLKQDDEIPPYFEKQRRDYAHEIQQQEARQRKIREFMQANKKENEQRKVQARREAEKENQYIQRNVEEFNKKVVQRESMIRNKSSLLGSILKEQMLLRQQSKAQV